MADLLTALLPQWRSAEQRLYPVILGDPEGFQRYVTAARGVADELASIADLEALAAAYDDGIVLAGEQLQRAGVAPDPATAELVAGAGFALRHRELLMDVRAAEMSKRIGEARAAGQRWVVLDEAGTLELARFGQYRRLEMQLPEGAALYSFTEAQIESDYPLYVVELLRLDPASGEPTAAAEERLVFGDMAQWQAAVADLRDRLDTQ